MRNGKCTSMEHAEFSSLRWYRLVYDISTTHYFIYLALATNLEHGFPYELII